VWLGDIDIGAARLLELGLELHYCGAIKDDKVGRTLAPWLFP
jgi:hypothetical protein